MLRAQLLMLFLQKKLDSTNSKLNITKNTHKDQRHVAERPGTPATRGRIHLKFVELQKTCPQAHKMLLSKLLKLSTSPSYPVTLKFVIC